jgi:hypothetical protein
MFRVSVKTQDVRGEKHYHATMTSHLGNIVGILLPNAEEWPVFLAFCSQCSIEVRESGSVPAEAPEAAAAR